MTAPAKREAGSANPADEGRGVSRLKSVDVNTLTPIEAMNTSLSSQTHFIGLTKNKGKGRCRKWRKSMCWTSMSPS